MSVLPMIAIAIAVFATLLLAGEAMALSRHRPLPAQGSVVPAKRRAGLLGRWGSHGRAIALTIASAAVGLGLFGAVGLAAFAIAPLAVRKILERRRATARAALLETQLAETVQTMALALRSGLSPVQALEFAAGEAEPPMSYLLHRLLGEHRMGVPFEEALHLLESTLGTDDARMFVLVVATHHRSGGDLAGGLTEVAATVNQRVAARRELRALTAQGRISGEILGALPLVFLVVLTVTSPGDLSSVYRSPVGVGMVSTGLGLEGLAYLWIRRLLRVDL